MNLMPEKLEIASICSVYDKEMMILMSNPEEEHLFSRQIDWLLRKEEQETNGNITMALMFLGLIVFIVSVLLDILAHIDLCPGSNVIMNMHQWICVTSMLSILISIIRIASHTLCSCNIVFHRVSSILYLMYVGCVIFSGTIIFIVLTSGNCDIGSLLFTHFLCLIMFYVTIFIMEAFFLWK
jgi:hypothetical protein